MATTLVKRTIRASQLGVIFCQIEDLLCDVPKICGEIRLKRMLILVEKSPSVGIIPVLLATKLKFPALSMLYICSSNDCLTHFISTL